MVRRPLRQLRRLDCPLVQGFLIARPERPASLDLRFFGADPMLGEVTVALTS
jgi:EAL domain-containing protein (putative c-di-GMP-specific phosphodiesterase class I)